MEIKRLSSLFVILLTFSVNCQELEPLTWQKEHPEISIIESKDLKNFSEDELNFLNGKHIIVTDNLTTTDIVNFENSQIKIGAIRPEDVLSEKELQFVKDWLSENSSVKIVKNSEFMSSDENTQNEYVKSNCLILKGEKLTREDILNHE